MTFETTLARWNPDGSNIASSFAGMDRVTSPQVGLRRVITTVTHLLSPQWQHRDTYLQDLDENPVRKKVALIYENPESVDIADLVDHEQVRRILANPKAEGIEEAGYNQLAFGSEASEALESSLTPTPFYLIDTLLGLNMVSFGPDQSPRAYQTGVAYISLYLGDSRIRIHEIEAEIRQMAQQFRKLRAEKGIMAQKGLKILELG